ncbi:hypothetical protein EJ110_NYTH17138 [Nymphaea thermarum]|nr:hypothetical protein EJ110_NYTH17138 [Nymphaea thermarum]
MDLQGVHFPVPHREVTVDIKGIGTDIMICRYEDHYMPMMVACARQLIENISKSGSSRPLLLSLGLKDHSSPGATDAQQQLWPEYEDHEGQFEGPNFACLQ